MKFAMLGALAGAGLVIAALGTLDHRNDVFAQRLTSYDQADSANQLIALSAPAGEQGQLLTVIDPRLRVMSVYHVDLVSGKIALRGVRNIHWDLQMTHFNNDNPLPDEIRSLLEPR